MSLGAQLKCLLEPAKNRLRSEYSAEARNHEGLKAAIREVLPEVAWQRCNVHFLRNAVDRVPRWVDKVAKRTLPILTVFHSHWSTSRPSVGRAEIRLFQCSPEVAMLTKFKVFAVAAALVAGTSSAAMAQYYCPSGYAYYNGVCQPVPSPGYSNPVSGAVSGEAAGAASGNATDGPIGAIVGGALGTAAGALVGNTDMLAGSPPAPAR